MNIDTYFSRPGNTREIQERIKLDIKYAQQYLYIAQYNFTDKFILEEVIKSNAIDKKIIVNYDNEQKVKDKIKIMLESDLSGYKFDMDSITSLGSKEEKYNNLFESCMHHKFIITEECVWTGSYNFSMNASLGNWENVLRITDNNIQIKFRDEFFRMYSFSKAIKNKLKSNVCIDCNKKIEDPFDHFKICVDFVTEIISSKPIISNSDSFYDIDIECYEILKNDNSSYSESEWKNIKSNYVKRKVVKFNSTCKDNYSHETSKCHVCNKTFFKNNLNLVRSINYIYEKLTEFSVGVYPDEHERDGEIVFINDGNKAIDENRQEILEEIEVCLTCFEDLFNEKNNIFKK